MSREQPSQARPSRSKRILRSWRGVTRAADAERYVDYMSRTGLSGLRATPGNLGVLAGLRVASDRAEHVVISLWESEAAIHGFAGDEVRRAVFYPEDARFLIERDEQVDHFTVVFEDGWGQR